MTERFTIADLHLGHEKTCTTFKMPDGVTPLRPFKDAEEMDEEIVKRWNATVSPGNTVYVLGDIVINRKHLHKVGRLNGRKILVPGNHDLEDAKEYLKYFADIRGYSVWVDDFIMSHIPLHPDAITTRFKVNVHGHYHANRVTLTDQYKKEVIDPRYYCVSVEHTDFTPLHFDDLRAKIAAQRN